MHLYRIKVDLKVRCQASGITQIASKQKFQRRNPKSDKFKINKFHHVEFWCSDATNLYKRFQIGLGMELIGKSDLSTQNTQYASYVLQSSDINFVLTAPQLQNKQKQLKEYSIQQVPYQYYDQDTMDSFIKKHGIAVKAIGIEVGDAFEAYEAAMKNGAISLVKPVILEDKYTNKTQKVAEVVYYNNVALRFVSGDYEGNFMPNYQQIQSRKWSYGLQSIDHVVGNVFNLKEATDYIKQITGFHEFAEFTADDVGTMNSGLNSTALASNNEEVITPVNEPTYGTKKKSQIQTYLEQNQGAGVQHIALKSSDIFQTINKMREYSDIGGFEFQNAPPFTYYQNLPNKVGDSLSPEQYKLCEQYGILVDKDDQGVLLQIFTKPVGDRPTFFFEIIQRIGCTYEAESSEGKPIVKQRGGCGGFGKGNFSDLFRSIEEYESTLRI